MRPKLATLMHHLKAANARLDQSLQAIEDELLQVRDAEVAIAGTSRVRNLSSRPHRLA
jgi:hypothetical protein